MQHPERITKTVELNQRHLLELFQRPFPELREIHSYQLLSGGAANTTYLIGINGDEYVLRLYTRNPKQCRTEIELYNLVKGRVLTPKFIYGNPEHQPYPFSIFEYVKGRPLDCLTQQEAEPLSFQLGKVLAEIHAFKFQRAGLFENGLNIVIPFEKGTRPYYEECYELLSHPTTARSRLGEPFAKELLAFIVRHQEAFPLVGEEISLIHSDFKPVNLILNTAGQIVVLDWEFAHAGLPMLDFAILLRHRDLLHLNLEALQKGYQEHGGRLNTNWVKSASLTDFVNLLTMMDTPADRPKLYQEFKTIMHQTMATWDAHV